MSLKADVRLAPRQRLARGLKYTAVGPVDVTRGVVGIGVDSTAATAAALRKRYRSGQLRKELAAAQQTLAQELTAAQELVTGLPQTLQARRAKRRRRPLVIAGVAAAVLAGGAVAFSIVRRSTQPEPSPLPPSVEVTPKP
ncbi:cell wall synthesis protein CwsA [Mycolicibacterium sp. S2-37]|uniref:cell wall synthesis protein CwsA n=1 Tax=Mycolicibacterium sp. S2-37 TaxID=2810297 RepID=UPI001A949FCE|nr:cell wall synthesis protein CwsA [Mycolicibacterium sp. S2-37]MBO0680040.1 cell wall synthesis protein CwsA [Mycolicibacterium sp. S2-37]